MDKLFVLAAQLKPHEITDTTVQGQLFDFQNMINLIRECKEKAKSEDVKKVELNMQDVKKLKDFLKNHEKPLETYIYLLLLSKLRSVRLTMEEMESKSLAQREAEAEEDEDEDEEEGDMKVRAMVTKLMSSTKNSILRDDRDFISKVLLEYLELKKKCHE